MKKNKVDKNWQYAHANDYYVKKSKIDGYRSRAAYKLIEIDDKFSFFNNAKNAVDLGAFPGGWSQVINNKYEHIDLFAVDLKELIDIPRVNFIKCNLISDYEDNFIILKNFLPTNLDIVLSDMAPNTNGNKTSDHLLSMELCEIALEVVSAFLNEGGKFACKIFIGGEESDFVIKMKKIFKKVCFFKPKSSKNSSREIYLIGLDKINII
ncbi:MAG: RlmE family RNA methyltransferase [Anaplasmataceae bacterium]|nr:RlmE family RNA methyltransferase [Anaplasmataceae bacterium]